MKKIYYLLLLSLSNIVNAQICIPNVSSLKFNGNSDYIQINSSTGLSLDSAITIEAWIKPSAWGTDYWDNTIFCKHSWSTGEQGYVLRCGGDAQLSFNFAGYAGGPTSWKDVVSGANALQLDVWQHVAGSFDGFRMRLFVNGVMVEDSLFVGTMVPSTAYNPCIGRLSDFGAFETRYFKGKIDEVRVWNRSLSPDEIIAHMSVHLDPAQETGLVGYWRLNDSTGTLVSDLSSNANNGTKYGAAWQLDDVPFDNAAAIPTITEYGDLLVSSYSSAYQWFLDGNEINGATDQSYLTTQSGTYFVEITDSIGCSAISDSVEVIPTSVSTVLQKDFVILGNPATETIRILLPENFFATQIELMDVSGRMIRKENVNHSPKDISIDVKGLSGLFVLRLYDDKKFLTQKVMLQ